LPSSYDVVVAGVGSTGSAAVCELARRGHRVLGLDRFEVPNALSSHHGVNRIIRLAYFEGTHYVPLVRRALELWRRLESETGETLLHVTGSLDIGPEDGTQVAGALASCLAHDIAHEMLDAAAIARRFPGCAPPPGYHGLFQPDGGFLAAEASVAAQARLARTLGAEIRERDPVLGWEPKGDRVLVRTASGTIEAARLVLSSGPWIAELAPMLDGLAVPTRQIVGWFETADGAAFAPGRFPVFVLENEEGRNYYGFPEWGAPGFKIGCHHHLREAVDPGGYDRSMRAQDEDLLRGCITRFFPKANGRLLDHRGCLYTEVPDEDFILDLLPGCPQVVVASACSGHGFKFSPALGELVADLVERGDAGPAGEPFRLARLMR
jgi:sarcosine oxidase